MAQIPIPASPTVSAIYAWWAAQPEPPRPHLGASAIGRECSRELWYGFRWALAGEPVFDGRMRRLFNRGHREEPVMVEELRGIGYEVYDLDPATGKQFAFKAVAGHFGASLDGVARGVLEAPKAWHVLEFKTAGSKAFADLTKRGVQQAKPEHHAQMQVYMRLASLERALYLAVNKDTDELHSERLRLDAAAADALLAKAGRVIFAPEPLPRLSDDPAFWKCKFCAAARICHSTALPSVNCRTCLHSTPERDGVGRWSCALAPAGESIPESFAQHGCAEHRYIPALLSRWGAAVDAAEGWVEYRAADGLVFRNGASGPGSYTSAELHAATPALLRSSEFMAIRDQTGGVIVCGEANVAQVMGTPVSQRDGS